MGFDLKEVRERVATVDVYNMLGVKEYRGKLNVTYKVFSGSTEDVEKAAELWDEDQRADLVRLGVEDLLSRIVSWDMTMGGEAVLLEPEVVKALVPRDVLTDIGEAISLHNPLGKKKAKNS